MVDTLAPRGIIGVMTPAMNTVVQPELELLRPQGISNQMQRFRLGGEAISDDVIDEAEKLMDCHPAAIAVGLTTDAGPGGIAKLAARCREMEERVGVPVVNASAANHDALRQIGARRVAVVTPFNAEIDAIVKANTEEAGFEVVAIKGTEAPSLPAICETTIAEITAVFDAVAEADCEAILQVGTALPVVAILAELEARYQKPIIACNAAVYWKTLRMAGIKDQFTGYGHLFEEC